MKRKYYICILLGGIFIAAIGTASRIPTHEPMALVLKKAATHDVLFLGTTHRQPKILNFISKLIPRLHPSGITHIGLEISSDQQMNLDYFMETGRDLSDIHIFPGIDCPEYRRMLQGIRMQGLTPVALDLPKSKWRGTYTRDRWMAKRIAATLGQDKGVKIVVVIGNLHTLKKVDWVVPGIDDQFIRYHLKQMDPTLSAYSVAGSINESANACDFQSWFGGRSDPVGIETSHFDRKLGLTRTIAARPLSAHQAVDAVIVF